MTTLFTFMSSNNGRATRIVAGLALVALGVALQGGWWAVAIVGLVPLLAGIFDVCVFAPLFGRPFTGPKLRATAR